VEIKDTLYMNLLSFQDLEVNVQREIAAFSIQEFYHVGKKYFWKIRGIPESWK
jgi:hypothetical protein